MSYPEIKVIPRNQCGGQMWLVRELISGSKAWIIWTNPAREAFVTLFERKDKESVSG